jgi:hypothetical protein
MMKLPKRVDRQSQKGIAKGVVVYALTTIHPQISSAYRESLKVMRKDF